MSSDSAPPKPAEVAPPAARRSIFSSWRTWMTVMMAVAVLFGASAGAYEYFYRTRFARPAPKIDPRYEGAARLLGVKPIVSPSEEYPGPNGETLYLTEEQFKAVNAAATLPRDAATRLAVALSEPNADKKAAMLIALMQSVPQGTEADAEAVAIYKMTLAANMTLPTKDQRTQTKAQLDSFIACRVIGRGIPTNCTSRPPYWIVYVLGGSAAGFAAIPLVAFIWIGMRRDDPPKKRMKKKRRAAELGRAST
ncbi:MAG: hypothetical protein U0271_45895 [Polyangiaceae bacterium]